MLLTIGNGDAIRLADDSPEAEGIRLLHNRNLTNMLLEYHGSATGRWTALGKLLPENLPRKVGLSPLLGMGYRQSRPVACVDDFAYIRKRMEEFPIEDRGGTPISKAAGEPNLDRILAESWTDTSGVTDFSPADNYGDWMQG